MSINKNHYKVINLIAVKFLRPCNLARFARAPSLSQTITLLRPHRENKTSPFLFKLNFGQERHITIITQLNFTILKHEYTTDLEVLSLVA